MTYLSKAAFFSYWFTDSNKSMGDVLPEFKDGGRLRTYNPDGVSKSY